MVIDPAAVVAVGKHFKFGSIFLEGTLEVEASSLTAGDELIIEADHFITNTVAYSAGSDVVSNLIIGLSLVTYTYDQW